jgi:hypothetical protein
MKTSLIYLGGVHQKHVAEPLALRTGLLGCLHFELWDLLGYPLADCSEVLGIAHEGT